MGIISWIIWGFFVGLFARGIKPGRQPIGCLWTIVLGIAGSLLGGFLATELLHIGNTDKFDLGSFVIAIVTSVILLAIWEWGERALPNRKRNTPPRGGL